MKNRQTLWLLVAAFALFCSSLYSEEFVEAVLGICQPWFGGNPLPGISQQAVNASKFVSRLGVWIAGALALLAGTSFFVNRSDSSGAHHSTAKLNKASYYASRGALLILLLLALLQPTD